MLLNLYMSGQWSCLWNRCLVRITCGINPLIPWVSPSLSVSRSCPLAYLLPSGKTDVIWGILPLEELIYLGWDEADWHKGLPGAVESEAVLVYSFHQHLPSHMISGHHQLQHGHLFGESRERVFNQCTPCRETDRGDTVTLRSIFWLLGAGSDWSLKRWIIWVRSKKYS